MTSSSLPRALGLGLAGAIALATPSFAAPVLSSTTAVKQAATDNVVDVQWRRWGHRRFGGAGVAAGLAFGALAGAAIASATTPYYYGYPGYAYGYPAYGAYAYEAPVTYGYNYGVVPAYNYAYGANAYPYQTCGVYAGYGRWDYSQC